MSDVILKAQINGEADWDKLLKEHPEIEVNLSNKVISTLVTKLKKEIADQASECLNKVIWTDRSNNSWANHKCSIVLVDDPNVPGGFRFSLSNDTQYVLKQEASKLIKDAITDEIRRQTYQDISRLYTEAAQAAAGAIIKDMKLDELRNDIEKVITARIAEHTAKSLVAEMLGKQR